MEALDVEAPGSTKSSLTERLKALWRSVTSTKSRGFSQLTQEEVVIEDVIAEAGKSKPEALTRVQDGISVILLSTCIPST